MMGFAENVCTLQPIAIFAESAKTGTCKLCGFSFAGEGRLGPWNNCARCSHAGLFNDADVKARTMPKCRVEAFRPVDDGDVT